LVEDLLFVAMQLEQKISVPLQIGDEVHLLEDVDRDDGGFAGAIMFKGTVERYNPQTGLLRFEENDMGRAKFINLLDEAAGIQII
jgi:hypothetical protein